MNIAAIDRTEAFSERGTDCRRWREYATLRRELVAIQCQKQADFGKQFGGRAIARITSCRLLTAKTVSDLFYGFLIDLACKERNHFGYNLTPTWSQGMINIRLVHPAKLVVVIVPGARAFRSRSRELEPSTVRTLPSSLPKTVLIPVTLLTLSRFALIS